MNAKSGSSPGIATEEQKRTLSATFDALIQSNLDLTTTVRTATAAYSQINTLARYLVGLVVVLVAVNLAVMYHMYILTREIRDEQHRFVESCSKGRI